MLGVVAWVLYIGGLLLAIIGLLGYAGSLPLVVDQPKQRLVSCALDLTLVLKSCRKRQRYGRSHAGNVAQ
jgi:hypothetical protein